MPSGIKFQGLEHQILRNGKKYDEFCATFRAVFNQKTQELRTFARKIFQSFENIRQLRKGCILLRHLAVIRSVRLIIRVYSGAGIFVLSDEIYEKLCYNGVKPFSIAAVSEKMKDLTITINGVSKTYAMTGWRIGYLAAPKDIAKAIDSFQSHATSNACSIAQYATIEALASPEADVQKMVDTFDKRRALTLELLKEIDGVQAVEPDGAFYVMMVVSGLYGKSYQGKTIDGSIAFADALLEAEKVATIPGISFGADDCLRLSYSLSESDICEGLKRIKRFVENLQ